MKRYIANLKFEQWEDRLYLSWDGADNGDDAFQSVLKRIETRIGPTSSSVKEFVERCTVAFQKAGFQPFKS